jgi:DNA-binding winged helix-turn-helix (wHTH) protein/Tol biopolymer transport system component
MAGKSFVFRFADVEVREREFSLTKAGEALAVEPKAFRVLLILLRNPGKLIPKQELLDAVWGDAAVTENSLSRAVALLRKVLGDEARTPQFIETVATVGYRWVGRVEAVEEPAAVSTADASAAAGTGEAAKDGSRATTLAGVGAKSTGRSWWRWGILAGLAVVLLVTGEFLYVSRPLPQPRITAYTQITHDGLDKHMGGTDGTRLYYTQMSPNAILQIGVNGGETASVPISLPGTFNYLDDISPDGSNALINTKEEGHELSPMWVVPILGGAATRLGDGANGLFSPDGASVIYSTRKGDIFLIRTDGTDNHKLASVGSDEAGNFSWSPDGKTIRFDNGRLWEMSSDGSGLHALLANRDEREIQCCGRWTPDGHLYLFRVWNPPRPGSEIWALQVEHRPFSRSPSEPVRLTTGPMVWGGPLPGKDGKSIFARGLTLRGELSRIDTRSGGIQPFLGGISAEFVSFSPDGKSVTYVSYPEGVLWRADRDGSNRARLSGPPYYPGSPRWSPDSTQILFGSTLPDGNSANFLVSANGGTPQRLLPESDGDKSDANWSPDGKRILLDWGGLAFSAEKRDLRILDLSTRQIATVPNSMGLWSCRWSRDGRYIAALNYPQTQLRIYDFKTQRWNANPTDGDVEFPSFSQDGRFIYFLRYGRDQGVFRIPVSGGKPERVVDMKDWHMTGYFGFSMSLDPTDAPLILRDVGSNDIYALTLER